MNEERITLVGYNSKKQPYIFLVVGILIIITAVFCWFFAEGDAKYASIMLVIIGIFFIIGCFQILKQPSVALKIREDKTICFYSSYEETVINLDDVMKVYYWPAQVGLKITFVMKNDREHFTYLLSNCKEVKKHIIQMLQSRNIKIVKRYSRRKFV
jgi:uncharacterized membrane protein